MGKIYVLRDPIPNHFRIPVLWIPNGIEEEIAKINGILKVYFAGGNMMIEKDSGVKLKDLIPLIQEVFDR